MKKATIAVAVLAVILFAGTQAFAQETLPDYTKWDRISHKEMEAVRNGEDTKLLTEVYMKLDKVDLHYHALFVIYNEQGKPWLVLYTRSNLYKNFDSLVIASVNYYLFEDAEGKWSLIKDFSESKDLETDTDDFLKSQYDLEFKQ